MVIVHIVSASGREECVEYESRSEAAMQAMEYWPVIEAGGAVYGTDEDGNVLFEL